MKRLRVFAVSSLLLLVIAGCATVTSSNSFAVAMSNDEAVIIASSLTHFMAEQLPPASSTLAMAPMADNKTNTLNKTLHQQLRKAGFEVAESSQAIANAHAIRYLVTPLSTGLLVRLQIDNREVTGWFPKNSNGLLQANSSFTVRE